MQQFSNRFNQKHEDQKFWTNWIDFLLLNQTEPKNLKQLLNTDICRVPRSFSLANNKEKLLVKVINSPLLKNKRIVLLNTGINHTEVFQVIRSLNFCQALSATGSDFVLWLLSPQQLKVKWSQQYCSGPIIKCSTLGPG